MGPAFQATLDLLEWQTLCSHIADFASTAVGKRYCARLPVPPLQADSERLLQETSAVLAMEYQYSSILDFGGVSTGDAEAALRRAAKGGMVSAPQLRGVVTILKGAEKLKRQIQTVARQHDVASRGSVLWPLLQAVAGIQVPTLLVRDIMAAVNDEGEVNDSASEQLRMCRMRVKVITSRISATLKAYPGEVSERSGRVCIAAPAGTKLNNAALLGASLGGGLVYLEPAAVVGLNNELLAARAEAMAAEEGVLWELTGRLMGCLDQVQLAFDVVTWMDVTAAKARCGMWLDGVPPDFVPWDDVFRARHEASRRRRKGSGSGSGQDPAGPGSANSSAPGGVELGAAVQLRGLRHPLLQAAYLKQRAELEKLVLAGGAAGVRVDVGPTAGRPRSGPRQIDSSRLGTRKQVLYSLQGRSGESGQAVGSESSAVQRLAELRPPRPIDMLVPPDTSVVVVTGPNTGGKTAAMKAFGLVVCMAKVGMPVPVAAPARLPCYSSVLADIGDEQSLTANLSTFSGHLRRIQMLRGEADGQSLLLLDELGTGTDPTEGAALGTALLRRLVNGGVGCGALTIATTHHNSMTGLKFQDPRFENASVEFDEVALSPTYKLLWGVPGRSNALNIAARLGLDDDVIAAARQRLDASSAAADAAIAALEQVQAQLEAEDVASWAVQEQVDVEKRRVAEFRRVLDARQKELAQQRGDALWGVYVSARAVLRQLKQERKQVCRGAVSSVLAQKLDQALGEGGGSGESSDAWAAWEAVALPPGSRRQGGAGGSPAGSQDAWVHDWRRVLVAARRALGGAAGGVDMAASGADGEDDDAELEAELAELERQQERSDEGLQDGDGPGISYADAVSQIEATVDGTDVDDRIRAAADALALERRRLAEAEAARLAEEETALAELVAEVEGDGLDSIARGTSVLGAAGTVSDRGGHPAQSQAPASAERAGTWPAADDDILEDLIAALEDDGSAAGSAASQQQAVVNQRSAGVQEPQRTGAVDPELLQLWRDMYG